MKKFKNKVLAISLIAAMASTPIAMASDFTDTSGLNEIQLSSLDDAVNKGIINGYDDNTVRPYGTLTRAEFATMICRYMGYELGESCSFSDAAPHWATAYIQACVNKGAIDGIGDNLFAPEAAVTFNQTTKIVSIVSGMTSGQDIDTLGGYPLAYLTIGQNGGLFANLTTGMTGDDYNLSRIDAIVMINNAGIGGNTTAGVKRIEDMTQEEKNAFALELIEKYDDKDDSKYGATQADHWGRLILQSINSLNSEKRIYDEQVSNFNNALNREVNEYLAIVIQEHGEEIYVENSKRIEDMSQEEKNTFALELIEKYDDKDDSKYGATQADHWGRLILQSINSLNSEKRIYDEQVSNFNNALNREVNEYLAIVIQEHSDEVYTTN